MGFFYGSIGVWGLGWDFSMWVLVWVLWWFHPRDIRLGFLVMLGLRHRLLWFGSSGELFLGFYLWVFRWV